MNETPDNPKIPFALHKVGGAHAAQSTHRTDSHSAPVNQDKRLFQAQLHAQDGRYAEAMTLLSPLLRRKKPSVDVLFLMARIHEKKRNSLKAIEFAKRANQAHPNDESKLLIARAYRVMGRTDDAVAWADQVLKVNPGSHAGIVVKAGTLEDAGRVDEAEALLRPVFKKYENDDSKIGFMVREIWARILVQRREYAAGIEFIDKCVSRIRLPQEKVSLLHLKAKACDRSGLYDAAWGAAQLANAPVQLNYIPEHHTSQVEALLEIWSKENIQSFPITNIESRVPVFIAGMPRSGTSLIDQIIDAHPRASGVGEQNSIEAFAMTLSAQFNPNVSGKDQFGIYSKSNWKKTADRYIRTIRSMSPKQAERIVNKSLGNNKLLGLVSRLFPNTRVIHVIRDPRDVAISCFMGGFNNKMHPWTSRVEWVAHAWSLSMRMMDHWKNTLSIPILDVHYESLVSNPEYEFPRMIEFLGLAFDESCFNYHRAKRTVRTLSYDQVNQPLYTTSAGRNKHYAAYLKSISFPKYETAGR